MTGISNCNMSAGPRALITSTISTIIHDIYMVTYRERDWRRDSPCKHQVRWTAQQPVWFWDLNAVHDWVALFTRIFFPPGVLTLPQVPHGASLIRAFLPWHFHVTTRCFSAAVWRIVIRGWHDGGCYSLNHRQGPITVFLFYAATSVCVSQCMCTHATCIISDRRGSSCHLCIWGGSLVTFTVCMSVPLLIARDKPIAANKRGVKLPEWGKVTSPSSCPHLLSKPWHFPAQKREVCLKSFHASVDKLDQPIG